MSSRFLSLVADEVRANELIFTTPDGKPVGSVTVSNDKFIFNPPVTTVGGGEMKEELRKGATGSLNDGISSRQSTNVVSFIPGTKTMTFRELGLYNDKVSGLENVGSEVDEHRIVSNYSIIPNIHGLTGTNQGLSLGNAKAYWKGVYASEVYTSTGTIYITDPETEKQMSIKYNPESLTAYLTNEEQSVETITTSKVIPGIIDAYRLPFTGLSFIGNFKPKIYKDIEGISGEGTIPIFDQQTLSLIYTLRYSQISEATEYTAPPNSNAVKTNGLFQMLSGAYYVVAGLDDGETIDMKFSTMTAETDLEDYNKSWQGTITSTFVPSEEKIYKLGNNDMLTLSIGLVPIGEEGKIGVMAMWSQVVFRVPIGGITTSNIADGAITNRKLAIGAVNDVNIQNSAVTNTKLSNNSVSTDNLAIGAVTFEKLSVDLQKLFIKPSGSVTQDSLNILLNQLNTVTTELTAAQQEIIETNKRWEARMLAVEEFIKVYLGAFGLRPNNKEYSFTGYFQNSLFNFYVFYAYGRKDGKVIIKIDELTKNITRGKFAVYDGNGNTIFLGGSNSFTTVITKEEVISPTEKKILYYYLCEIPLGVFNMTFQLSDLSSNVVASFTLSQTQYQNLPVFP